MDLNTKRVTLTDFIGNSDLSTATDGEVLDVIYDITAQSTLTKAHRLDMITELLIVV